MIPDKIIKLTELALKDATITNKERSVIVNEAIKLGCTEEEVNYYINQRLDIVLKNRPKELLKSCPSCGAQIPIIADECPYCSHKYQSNRNIEISDNLGTAGKIIEQENENTETERINISNCPNCGHPYPLISNICPACKHVLHNNNELAVKKLIENINKSINSLINLPKVGIFDIIKFRLYLIPIYFALWLFFIGRATNEINITTFGFIIMIFSFFIINKGSIYQNIVTGILLQDVNTKYASDSPVYINQLAYRESLSIYQMFVFEFNNFYGENSEVKNLLNTFNNQIINLKNNRRKKNIILYSFFIIPLLLSVIQLITSPSMQQSYNNSMSEYENEWKLLDTLVTVTPYVKNTSDAIKIEGNAYLQVKLKKYYNDNKYIDLTNQTPDQLQFSMNNIIVNDTLPFNKGIVVYDKDYKSIAVLYVDSNNNTLYNGQLIDFKLTDYIWSVLRNAKYYGVYRYNEENDNNNSKN
ncbi:MAG: zinc ribbon domain-containing protein [Bacteroidales bacterium]|nr:zinc ribbon domain-containing protein [Bacteroidales bacterium]